MSSTDWIQELKVAELKEELKKRGQPVAGKKAELTARLEEYVKEHEAGSVEEPAVEEEKAEAAAEQAAPAAEEAATAAQEERAPEKEAKAAKEREPKAAPAAKAEVVPAEAKVPAADDVDLDYGESDDEQPQKQEAKPAEESAEKPVAAAAGAEPSKKQKEQEQEMKKKKKAEPDSRKRPTSDVPQSEEEARPEKQAKTEQQHTKPKQPAGSDAPAAPATTEKAQQQQERKPGSRALLIEGFVRPFTENQARTLLGQSGTVVAMWMPSIRNLAWVVYSTTSEAEAAKTALFKLQWPAGSPKVLMPRSVSIRAAEKAIGHGNGNEDFKIERSEEDGPDEAEIENNTSKSMDVVGTITIPAGHPSSLRQQQQATADEEVLKDASPLRVKDLRELLSRKSTGGVRTAERKRRDPGPNLDELFRKTTAKPAIYWMPLSEEAVELKKKAKAATAGAGGSGGGQGGYSKRRSLAAWYARPASAARVSIQIFNGSCLTSKARKPATMPPKNEMGSATTAATIPSNPSLEGFLSLPMPLEAAHIHLLKMALFTPRLGRLGREDREKEVIDKDIFEIVRGMWERAMLPIESSSLGLAFRIALCSILVDNAWKHATFTCCGLKFFLRVLRNFLPKFSRCPPRSYLAAGQMMVQQKKISGGSPPYNTYIKPAMGALFQAVGPPLLEFPLSFEKMTHRRKPGASPAVHLPLASGNKGMAWTEAEHLAFLNGLKAFGRASNFHSGQWKQISRYYVPSRTPTQVASHAQKHFLRLTGTSKRRSRFATLEDLPTDVSPADTVGKTHQTAEEQLHVPASPAAAPAGVSTASEGAISSATGASARIGAHMGPSYTQFGGGMSFSLPPPADASGLALGFPIPQPPQLITSPTGKLPMLPVQPGRLNLNKPHSFSKPTYTHSLHTVQQLPTLSKGESKPRAQREHQVQRRETTTAVRRAHLEQARELRERLHAANNATTHRTTRKTTPQHESHSGSVCSDTTSTPYTAALDALAGVAAALADSAGNFL